MADEIILCGHRTAFRVPVRVSGRLKAVKAWCNYLDGYIHLMLDYLCGTVDGGRSQLIDTKFIGDSGQVCQ
ncbi:hypothetical protein M5K25_015634 [Dendrobium thyrsiflorum]|uniref:Uncharacterized protein n=1 Tax=Dendrobium thyrsiflorum TaxID=117978 RepID=A0ABD0UXP1_DENTH